MHLHIRAVGFLLLMGSYFESTARVWEIKRHRPEDGGRVAQLLLCKQRITWFQGSVKGYSRVSFEGLSEFFVGVYDNC